MSKEQQELLDDAYNRYRATIIKEFYEDTKELRKWATVEGPGGHTKEEFINKCKTDTEFSEKWGLKIEQRELSNDERFRIAYKNLELRKKLEAQSKMLLYPDGHNKVMDDANIPTKLITITYNDKTIESYE
jgi:hypothetical protein